MGLAPDFFMAHNFSASALIDKRMYTEAEAEARKAIAANNTASHPKAFLGCALAKSGAEQPALAVLAKLLESSSSNVYVSPYSIAQLYNCLGERDEAFAWLERGFEQRDHKMGLLKVEPKWNNLHDDPRYQDLVRRVGF